MSERWRRGAGGSAASNLVAAAMAIASALPLAAGAASAQGAPYVPLDDPAYLYVDALLARGGLRSLTALERPYPADALAAAAGTDTISLGEVGRAWARALVGRARSYLPARSARPRELAAALAVEVELAASRSARREVMLANRDAAIRPAVAVHGALTSGPVVAAARWRADASLADDPEYTGPRGGEMPGRMEDAYVGARWSRAELVVGRLSRDWGPPTVGGLQIGSAPYSYDHLYGRLGTDRVRLQTVLARLDDAPGLHAPNVRRYLAVHRLAGRWGDLEWAATESYVYSGAGRRPDLALSNPFLPAIATHYLNDETGNLSAAVDLLWRSPVGLLAVQAMVDDYQFESGNPGDDEPPSYGLSLVADGLPLAGEHRAFATYTRVANLAYRTTDPGDGYTVRQVGLGRAFSDYDELRVGVELALLPMLPVRAYVAHRRQGGGDYRLPFPDVADYGVTPSFLATPTTRITRTAVSAGGTLRGRLGVEGDVGYNRLRGPGVVLAPAGRRTIAADGLAGTIRLSWTPGWLRAPG
ncbi:MAG: hypothetical protein ACYC2G_07465 [Gemmatimonadaceae bacterium]